MSEVHPAMAAARSSWRCVMEKNRDEWLGLMADDVCFEDPIGVAPTNPTGEGVRGKAALEEFWKKNMEPATIVVKPQESYAAGNESAHVLVLETAFPNGVKMTVRGIFTYTVDEAGKLTNLRGYWSMGDAKIEQPG